MDETPFDYLRELVRKRAAIVLGSDKVYLMEARLAPVAREEDLDSVDALIESLRSSPHGRLHDRVVDAMTTNETSFFRDRYPFDCLTEEAIPQLMRARADTRQLSLWCGASSSGQEPYSIAMLLRDRFPELVSWTIEFVATDISQEMLSRAASGTFSKLEVNRGLPIPMLVKYFTQHGDTWKLKDEIRDMIDFRPLNLAQPWPSLPRVDIVFLRNVMIYFDVDTKRDILRRLEPLLRPDGYLFLGGAETTMTLSTVFERVAFGKASCYRLLAQ